MSKNSINKLAKNQKYKGELEAQLNQKRGQQRFEDKMKYNPNIQKGLFDDYKRFEQKEYDRVNN